MAKFCNQCGTALVDGKCPKCSIKKEKVENPEEVVEENVLTEYVDLIKGMFKKPVETIKNNIEESNFTVGILSLIICAIVFGIFMQSLVSNLFSKMGLDLSIANAGIVSINSRLARTGLILPTLSLIGIKMAILFALGSLMLAGIIYFIHAIIYKKKINFKKIMIMIGIIEIPFTIILLVAIITSFIHFVLALIILVIGISILMVHLHQGILLLSKMSKTQTIYTIAICIGLSIIAFLMAIATTLFISMIIMSLQATGTSLGL